MHLSVPIRLPYLPNPYLPACPQVVNDAVRKRMWLLHCDGKDMEDQDDQEAGETAGIWANEPTPDSELYGAYDPEEEPLHDYCGPAAVSTGDEVDGDTADDADYDELYGDRI